MKTPKKTTGVATVATKVTGIGGNGDCYEGRSGLTEMGTMYGWF